MLPSQRKEQNQVHLVVVEIIINYYY